MTRTDELVGLCEKNQIFAVEVGADEPNETGSEMLWPRAEGKRTTDGMGS